MDCILADINGTCLAIASLAALLYDYFLTLADEVELFWSGPWTMTRVLFLLSRYTTPVMQIVVVLALALDRDVRFHTDRVLPATLSLAVITNIVIQAIIVIRVWFMYPRKWITRLLVVGTFLACAATMIVELIKIEHSLGTGNNTNCAVPGSDDLWKVFVPVLVVHTVLFITITWPAIRVNGRTSLLGRLARDGCVLYVLVFITIFWNTIAAARAKSPSIMNSGAYSNLITVVPTICISHIMLNVRSMAASLNVHSDMLLSAAELSRLQWRPGTRAGEIVVDVDTVEDDHEAPRMPCMTRLGEIEMTGMPGVEDSRRMIDRALDGRPYGVNSDDSEGGSVLSMP